MKAYDPAVSVKPAVKVGSNQLTDNCMTESPEEREAFERLTALSEKVDWRQLEINRMVLIGKECRTTSVRGICALLHAAGCRFDDVQRK
jgi:hypothetical protein